MPSPLEPQVWRRRLRIDSSVFDRHRLIGLAGSLMLALGGTAAGALPKRDPFSHVPLIQQLRFPQTAPVAMVIAYGGVALLVVAWLFLGRLVGTPGGPTQRSLLVTLALWAAPLVVAAPMFSRDVYSYAAQGWMVAQHANPYFWGPAAIPGPYLTDVSQLWANTPAPYGPVFLMLARAVVGVANGQPVPMVFGFRLIALVGVLLLARYLPRLARHCGVGADKALWLGVLNPLVLMHLIAAAHNDALMIGMIVAALVFVLDRRPVLGVVVCALALLVKAPAALALVFMVPLWASQLDGRATLARAAARVVAVAAPVIAGVDWLSGLGYGWLNTLQTPSVVRNWLSPTTLLGESTGVLTRLVHLGDYTDTALAVFRGAGGLAALVLCLLLLARAEKYGLIGSLGLAFVAVVALGPVVQAYYPLWGFVLIAAGIASPRARGAVAVASAFLAMVVMPKGGTVDAGAVVQAVLAGIAVASAAVLFELLPLVSTRVGTRSVDGAETFGALPPIGSQAVSQSVARAGTMET